jgi:hypothetical protein
MNSYKITKVVKEITTAVYTVTVEADNVAGAQAQAVENDMTLNWSEDQNEMQDAELLELIVSKL